MVVKPSEFEVLWFSLLLPYFEPLSYLSLIFASYKVIFPEFELCLVNGWAFILMAFHLGREDHRGLEIRGSFQKLPLITELGGALSLTIPHPLSLQQRYLGWSHVAYPSWHGWTLRWCHCD